MNYRHIYHAGNFADVFRHIILVALLEALQRKDSAFCYLDTHAGIGRYDLNSVEAQKTKEFLTGIDRVINYSGSEFPDIVKTYLHCVREEYQHHLYPGSPLIARRLLRAQDQMILSELHPEDFRTLKSQFIGDKQVAVHHLDGYLALKAFLPPKTRRGLVLIDPPFEREDEVDQIIEGLKQALKRWQTGVYALWYPIKDNHLVSDLHRQLKLLTGEQILCAEFTIMPADQINVFRGCGMALINPPWKFDEQLKPVIDWLWSVLSPEKQGGYRLEHLL